LSSRFVVNLVDRVGEFAVDKDAARKIRTATILPALDAGADVVLDFRNVQVATQSFVHALISEPVRRDGREGLRRLVFKNTSPTVKRVIKMVVAYSLANMPTTR
jgi:hypothetical protein